MNKSRVLESYNALAAMELTIDGVAVKGIAPEDLPNAIVTAVLPVRLLTPISRFSGQVGNTGTTWNVSYLPINSVDDWQITELFLWEAVNQNVGIKAMSGPLIKYCTNYLEVLASGGLQLPVNSVVTNVSFRPDVIEYPIFSGHGFYGVITNITLMEKIP